MSCQNCKLCLRMTIYLGTIFLHSINIVALYNSFHGESIKNEAVKRLSDTQIYFFTCWTFVLQMVYAVFGLICDWKLRINTSEKKIALPETVMNLRDSAFTVIVWPPTLLVASYFWGFYFYDRNLFYPEIMDTVIPSVCNHIMHTLIVGVALLELVLYPRSKPDSSVVRLLCLYGLAAAYVCALLYAHSTHGIWMYPIFDKLDGLCFSMFFVVTALYLTILYYFQYCVSSMVMKIRERIARRYCKTYCIQN